VTAFYFLLITFPLIREGQSQDQELAERMERLLEAGQGRSSEEVLERIERLRTEIGALSEIEHDPARGVHFAPEVKNMLGSPFQLLEYDHRKFVIIDRIRGLLRTTDVTLLEDWERRFPVPGGESSYLLWAQLTVIDQLIRTAIEAGVKRIDDVRLIPAQPVANSSAALGSKPELAVQMRLTGPMDAIHTLIMMLPLNGDELAEIGLKTSEDPKSSFFISRFILKKSSAEAFDEVSLEFVANAFLQPETAHQ
jgi:hypothetical protein